MPCMGPENREKDADEAFDEFFLLLQTRYHIADPDHVYNTVVGLDGVTRKVEPIMGFGVFNKDCRKAKNKLKKAIREVFKYDSYNGF